MSDKVYRYIGEKFKQGDAPHEIVSFVAPATDIKRWGGIPQKTSRFHGGFQRALAKRYKKIKKFFEEKQTSPTSIVVAFREDKLKTAELSYPGNWPDKKEFDAVPEFVDITFENATDDVEALSLKELLAEVCNMLQPRIVISADTTDDEESEDESGEDSEEDTEGEDETDSETDESSDDELDVGHSKLKEFYDFISSEEEVNNWIKKENAKKGNNKPEEELKSLLVSMLRPAMIVDGQHRVSGAYESDNASDIYFTVNAIKDADWIEQVFQFVVLNKLAKPISPSFLTSILNTSLTNEEVKNIEGRLEGIGIKNSDRKIIKYLNHDERSPFFGKIAEPGEMIGISNEGKLSDKGMIRLMKRWRTIDGPKKTKEMKMFMKAIGAKNLTVARSEWKNYETWVPYFYAFWDTIKEKYESQGIWEKRQKFHLLYIVTMHSMQDMFLAKKSDADVKFSSLDDMKSQVKEFFEPVPATFFQNWEATGLQSGDGPQVIMDAIAMFKDGKNLSTVQKNSPLFEEIG